MKFEFPNGIIVNIRPITQNTINHNIKKDHNLNDECCMTCKNYISNNCKLNQGKIFDDKWTVCDYYKRKRSGAYRRKRAKYNERRKDNDSNN